MPSGALWVAAQGGKDGAGALVKIGEGGKQTMLSLDPATGWSPLEVIADESGRVFTLTQYGPTNSPPTIFSLTDDGALQRIFSASEGEYVGGLGWARPGVLYATASGAGPGQRLILLNTNGNVIRSIPVKSPQTSAFVLGPDQQFYYILLPQPGDPGAIAKVSEDGAYALITKFTRGGPAYTATLISGKDGFLYGLRNEPDASWTIFRLATNGVISAFASFGKDFQNGDFPTQLVAGYDGTIYGSLLSEDGNIGGLFRVATNGSVSPLLRFDGATNGYIRNLLFDRNGYIQGTSIGSNNVGTVFQATPTGDLQTLAIFRDANGFGPTALVAGPDGRLYGATGVGGLNDTGTIFALSTNDGFSGCQSFPAGYWIYIERTSLPSALVAAADGNMYGTTFTGADDHGTIFRVTPQGDFSTVFMFNGTNGSNPNGRMLQGPDGLLYGVTTAGGQGYDGGRYSGHGTIFRFSPKSGVSTIASFREKSVYPGELALGSDHLLYLTSSGDGQTNFGSIFRISQSNEIQSLLSFGGLDGKGPGSRLVAASDGALYGTTGSGGIDDLGTVFRVTKSGLVETVTEFRLGSPVGYWPSSLVATSEGVLYGVTDGGAQGGHGAIFHLSLTGEVSLVASFDPTSGFNHQALVLGPDNNLYGADGDGGPGGGGFLFRLVLPRFLKIDRAGDKIHLRAHGSANAPFQIWTTPVISAPWTSGTLIGSGTFDSAGQLSFFDPVQGASSPRFYRLIGY